MKPRVAILMSLLSAVLLAAPAAPAAGIEGLYRLGGKDWVTVRIARGEADGDFAGTVVNANGDWHRQQINQTVLQLHQVGENQFRGRCSAYHVRFSDDMTAWLDVTDAVALPTGGLRCRIAVPTGGSVDTVYEKVAEAEKPAPAAKPDGGGIAGQWKWSDGSVVTWWREGEAWVGRTFNPAAAGRGRGDETLRVKPAGQGVYKGTVEPAAEDVEITVRGDALTCVRTRKDGTTARSTAARLPPYEPGYANMPRPKRDEGDLTGLWSSPDGTVNRYARDGDDYTGYVVKLSAERQAYGFRPGEESIRLRRAGPGYYLGKVKVKSEGGKDEWWEGVEMSVEGNALTFIRHMIGGQQEKGAAVRVATP